MADQNENTPATVPEQPEAKPPLRKSMPVVIALVVIVALIGIANISSLLSGNKRSAPQSALTMSPTTPNAQQVSSFESQQQQQARHDAEERQRQQELAAAMQQLQQDQGVPNSEADGTPPMTPAQRAAIYGESPNAPQRTSNMSEAQAEAKQKRLAVERQKQDARNSDTVAIDFSREGVPGQSVAVQAAKSEGVEKAAGEEIGGNQAPRDTEAKSDPMSAYPFDQFQGQLYRIFEGTVLEGVLTNHVDGGLSGPILVMLTTDYYSHDHQQLLMPQGTRLIGSVQSVGNAQQRKMPMCSRAIRSIGYSMEVTLRAASLV